MIQHPRSRRRLCAPGMTSLLMAALIVAAAPRLRAADAPPSKEYQVKAALLLNFAQFIQWPAGAFSSPDAPLVVGILGDDPFGTVLEQTFQDETIDGRKLVVKRSHDVNDLLACQMAFIAPSERDRIPDILKVLHDGSVVTVGETDHFASQGGIINFYMDAGRVRFEINADAARKKGLKVSAQLLKRARIVTAAGKE